MAFEDRVSTYPNRYLMTTEDGNTSHVILERADDPIVVGTPLNAETFNNMEDSINDKAPASLLHGDHVVATNEELDNLLISLVVGIPGNGKRNYAFQVTTVSVDIPNAFWVVEISKYINYADIVATSIMYDTLVVHRRYKSDGSLLPWEFENPPMKIGVEYRTTERFLGQPVYTMLVNFGALPVASEKTVTFSDDSTIKAFSVEGRVGVSSASIGFTSLRGYPGVEAFYAVGGKVIIDTNINLGTYYAYVQVKYTKG